MQRSIEIRKITMTSSLIAMAFVLDLISSFFLPMFKMPFGGNFLGISMLPLVMIGFLYGLKYGLVAGFIYGVFGIILAPSTHIIGWSFLLDYLFGFTAFGLAGLFKGKINNKRYLIIGIFVAGFFRYLSVSLAGVIFWSEFAGDKNIWYFSFIYYNLPYNATSILLTSILALIIYKRIAIINEDFIGQENIHQ